MKSKKILYYDNVLYYNLKFINGNIFYAIEYFKYFLDLNLNVRLVINCLPNFKNEIIKKWYDKYQKEIIDNIIPQIIFINKHQKIITKKAIILDMTSIKDKNINLFSKKYIYNYGDDAFQSLKKPLKDQDSKIITIGDRRLGYHIDYHLPLKLNFTLFKKYDTIQNNTFIENKTDGIHVAINVVRNVSDFHSTFNKVKIYIREFYDRANRLIPECNFYNKDIEIIKIQEANLRKDAIDLRLLDPIEFYDINKNINQEISWRELLSL